jgi:atypical dual specificity phosphatase
MGRAPLQRHFVSTYLWIREALASSPQARVFVHCFMGLSRSVSMMMAYLMIDPSRRLTYDNAYALLQHKRPNMRPNAGFRTQLKLLHIVLHVSYDGRLLVNDYL